MIVIEPADVTFEQMIGGIEEGLIVESTTGNPGNIDSGDFSGNVSTCFKVRHGKLVERVKDTMIAGNIFADLKQLGGISDSAEWVYRHMKMPTSSLPSWTFRPRRSRRCVRLHTP